jgi:hypothetical protein
MPNVSQLATPYLRAVTAVLPTPVRPVPPLLSLSTLQSLPSPFVAEGVLRLPEGAVVAPWPQAGLPAELVGGEVPMIGYLVLVPAERAPEAVAPVGAVTPLRSVAAPGVEESAPAGSAGIQLDMERRTALVDGELLELTYLEFELLAHLTANPHRVHSRDHLVTAVWGYGHIGDGRTVDVHIARLRRKLGTRYRDGIVTVRRVGYKYVPSKRA